MYWYSTKIIILGTLSDYHFVLFVLIYILVFYGFDIVTKKPEEITQKVIAGLYVQRNNFRTEKDVWGAYTLDLTLEAMLVYAKYSGEKHYIDSVQKIIAMRNQTSCDTFNYRIQPFCSINFELFINTGDSCYILPYIYETNRMMNNARFAENGAVTHSYKNKEGLLLDYLQEYASRLVRAGWLTGDSGYYEAALEQFDIYRTKLRNPYSGLYSQGIGFLEDATQLSPGAWSRGHGWLIRGMVNSLEYLPKGSVYEKEMIEMLKELADALLLVQDEKGMWHQLLHLPFDQSYPESSGTGMIAYALAISYDKGWLKDDKYKVAALKAINALKDYIDNDGIVLGTCKGPGPLYSIKDYVNTPAKPGDHHGPQAIIYAMAAEKILQNK